jgi:hypothetical protein
MEVLEAKLPKFFSGLGSLHRELGSNQQDVRNRNRVTHSYSYNKNLRTVHEYKI